MNLTTARLVELRRDARIERDALLEHRGRLGEDPADALSGTPSVDELVVCAIRDEMLEDRDQLAEFSMARLAARGSGPDAAVHRRNADLVEFALLREIAASVPQLAVAVWGVAHHLDVGGDPEGGSSTEGTTPGP